MDSPSKDAKEGPSFFLPDDLIEDIFARMPAKSVQRCRCLSHAWAATLSTRSFIDRHLRLANRRHGSCCRSLFFLPDYGSVTMHAWSPSSPLVPIRSDDEQLRGIAGVSAVTRQCRGLVVLEERRPIHRCSNRVNHYVHNPSTGQMTTLPKGKDSFGPWSHNHTSVGIGYYDANIQKHKVVRLYCCSDLPPACEVYVLNSTKGHWRPPAGAADKATPPGFATNYSVFAQGNLYWCGQPDNKNVNMERVIISFSISDEEFEILPPPPLRHMYPCLITELNGRLCLFNNTAYTRLFDIWMLHDHAAVTWGIHCRIDLQRAPLADRMLKYSWGVIPIDTVDDGNDILLRPDPHGIHPDNLQAHQLCVYRAATGDMEDLLTNDSGTITHHTVAHRAAVPYEESLESTSLTDTKS